MNETKRPRCPTVRQWLALDAWGTFLLGCGVFGWSTYLLCLYDNLGSVFIMFLYTIPVPLTLDLAALLLVGARTLFPSWRILTGIGAVVQIAAAVYNQLWEWDRLGGGMLNLLMLPVLFAGIVGLWAALLSPREPKPPAE